MVSVQRNLKYKSMRTMSVKIGPAWLPSEHNSKFILQKISRCANQDWLFQSSGSPLPWWSSCSYYSSCRFPEYNEVFCLSLVDSHLHPVHFQPASWQWHPPPLVHLFMTQDVKASKERKLQRWLKEWTGKEKNSDPFGRNNSNSYWVLQPFFLSSCHGLTPASN